MPRGSSASPLLDAPQRILDAALDVFAEVGFTGASTREIARRAKVHQPAIAYHFLNKETLWKAAADAVFEDFSATLAAGLEGVRDGEERLKRLAEIYVRFVARKPSWATFIVHEGMHTGPRSEWLIRKWLRPQARGLYETITGLDWPARDRARARSAISILSILTGSTLIFSERTQVRRLADVDPGSAEFINLHTQTVFAVLKTLLKEIR